MYCNCTIIPRHHWLFPLYSIDMSHFHGVASDIFLPHTASILTYFYIFKNISSHCLSSSHFLLSFPGFLFPFWRIITVSHWDYWGAGGKVVLWTSTFALKLWFVKMAKTHDIRPLMNWFYWFWSWLSMCFLCLYYTQPW